jgi:hypothetical protein
MLQLWLVLPILEDMVLTMKTERYLQMLEKHRVRGYLFEQQNYTDPSQLAAPAKK